MNKSASEEKRKHPRAPIRTEITCYKTPDEIQRGTGMIIFFSRDISVGGIFIDTSISLDIRSTIYLKFQLPNSPRNIIAQGKVVRINKGDTPEQMNGIGIEFEYLDSDDRKSIADYVKQTI